MLPRCGQAFSRTGPVAHHDDLVFTDRVHEETAGLWQLRDVAHEVPPPAEDEFELERVDVRVREDFAADDATFEIDPGTVRNAGARVTTGIGCDDITHITSPGGSLAGAIAGKRTANIDTRPSAASGHGAARTGPPVGFPRHPSV